MGGKENVPEEEREYGRDRLHAVGIGCVEERNIGEEEIDERAGFESTVGMGLL